MTRRADMTPDYISLLEDTGNEVVKLLEGVPLEVEGTPKASVKYADGTFKMKPIMAGWNFFVEYAYLGKRGEVLFGLSPEDAQEYEFVEFSHKVMDTVFPLAGSALAAKALCETYSEDFSVLFQNMVANRSEEIKKAENAARDQYTSDPKFGMF